MTTSKSPRRVLTVTYAGAHRAWPAHRHRYSPKKFTQHQLLACLVLNEFLRLDYRGFPLDPLRVGEPVLRDHPEGHNI